MVLTVLQRLTAHFDFSLSFKQYMVETLLSSM